MPTTPATLLPTTQQLADQVSTSTSTDTAIGQVVAGLTAAGISIDADSCNYADLQEKLSELVARLKDEAQKTIDNLAYSSFGNFFIITGVILYEFLGGAAAAIVESLISKALFEGVLGAVNSALAMVLASVPGMSILIQYYAALNLRTHLNNRIELTKILLTEIESLISWVSAFSQQAISYDTSYLSNLQKAHKEIGEATKLVGMEISSQLTARSQYISGKALTSAVQNIEDGLSFLSPGYALVQEQIKSINSEFGLTTPVPAVTISKGNWLNLSDWTNYIDKLWTELKNKYVNLSAEDSRELKRLIFKFLPVLPDFLKQFAVNTVIKGSSDVLIERVPIWILKRAKDQKWMEWTLTPPGDFLEFLNMANERKNYKLFSKAETKDITWQSVMNKAKAAEAALLLIPTYMTVIQQHSSMLKTILDPAYGFLQGVYDDMGGVIGSYSTDLIGSRQLNATKKFSIWTSNLLTAKGLLTVAAGGGGIRLEGYGSSFTLTSAQATDSLAAIEESLQTLESFIEEKNTDGKEVGDAVITVANASLSILAGQAAVFILNKNLSDNILANLRSLQISLREQQNLDYTELILVLDFISKVESFPGFYILKKYVDSLLKKMKEGNAFITSDLVNKLKTGDLSAITSYLDAADFGIAATNCIGQLVGIDTSIPEKNSILERLGKGLSKLGIAEDKQKEITESITALKKKLAIQNVLEIQLSEAINTASGT